jgi:hypothetical protein
MGASVIPAVSTANPSDNWVSIATATPSAISYTFSSISGYKKLMLRGVGLNAASDKTWTITFNGDTGAKYDYAFDYSATVQTDKYQVTVATGATSIGFPNQFSTDGTLVLTVNNTDTTGIKTLTGLMGGNLSSGYSNKTASVTGNYLASAAITSVTIQINSGTMAGTLSLYGVAS